MIFYGVEGCIDRHAPLKKLNKKLNKISKPWIIKYILKMISHRDRLFKKKKEYPFRSRITREIKEAKRKYYNEFFENNLNNMKT